MTVAAERARVSEVAWKDLLRLSRFETYRELALSAPWLLASWAAAAFEQYAIALACSFLFFLTGLRQVHNAFHSALNVSRTATDGVMLALSVLMLGSMHAVQVNHLRHHRYCMADEDVEAMSARLPAWQAVLVGPLFPFRLHRNALQVGTQRERRWITAELAANAAWIALVFGGLEIAWLRYHLLAMAAGQCLTAFFAVWTVHHGCESAGRVARTVRSRFKACVTYNMFFHVEHHLFPAVPTCKLHLLAQRIDAVAPELSSLRVF